jgi:CheY-like chemotaxis protein
MDYQKRVFLIDDDEDDCFFFESAIKDLNCGVSFRFEQSSEAALQQLQEGNIPVTDILFVDWNMPRLTGSQCLTAIRKIPEYSNIPIIIYTTSNSPADKKTAHELGATSFLTKPISIGDLCEKLQHIFSKNLG